MSASLWVRVGKEPRLVNLALAVALHVAEKAGRCYLVAEMANGGMHTLSSHPFEDMNTASRDEANKRVRALFEKVAKRLEATDL